MYWVGEVFDSVDCMRKKEQVAHDCCCRSRDRNVCDDRGQAGNACASDDDVERGVECQIEDCDADGDGVPELVGQCEEAVAHDVE